MFILFQYFFDFQCNLDDTFPPSNEFILVG